MQTQSWHLNDIKLREGKEKKISNVYVPSISRRLRLRKRERSILIIVN